MFVTPAYGQEAASDDQGATGPEILIGTEVPHEAVAEGLFPPFNPESYASQIVWLAITFGLFYLFLKRVAMPRLAGIVETRSDKISGDLDMAARMQEEADAAVAAYEQELAQARAGAMSIGQKARDEAEAEAETARQKIEAELDAKLAQSEAHIASIKSNAMKDVGAIAESTASAIIEQLVGKADKVSVAAAVKSVAG
ncbi:F0F1 ATP synthase subunit B [Aquamicrobium segne]|uniref:ATP synthase subunit b n=1 Tax=Aquamicrobium segne TaxID=469547 RepID=A0ABW0GUB0_9HYPH